MSEDTWVDVELEEALRADASGTLDLEPGAWGDVEVTLDQHAGPRDRLVSLSTAVRRALGLFGMGLCAGMLVVVQGVRGDLDATGWLSFIAAGWVLVAVGAGGTLMALRSTAARPLPAWPWLPLAWAFVLVWSAIGPWPGMTGVPAAMHLVCFTATSAMTVGATLWILLLERGPRPVPWRFGLSAASAGCTAFVAQSVFCPGIDYVHLVVGHGGPALLGGALAFAAAWLLGLRRA
ncbi:MAG: hypothetical protein H6736_08310 [Alphaproteobacteria bacterium]|nr:hypothetical protein [Alphaproteobacteria bacterium]